MTLTLVWPWPHLWPWPQQIKLSLTDVQVAELPFSMRWPWPWPNDLDTQTWPRYGQDITPYQKWSFYVNWFKSYSPNRQTDRQTHTHDENITSTAYAGGNNFKQNKWNKSESENHFPAKITSWCPFQWASNALSDAIFIFFSFFRFRSCKINTFIRLIYNLSPRY